MNDLIIKICGMREQAELDCAAALGVDLCGFIFAPQSPRAVTPEQAAALDSGDMLRGWSASSCTEISRCPARIA